MTTTKRTDDDLAARFEHFEFDSSTHTARDPLRALHWAAQFRAYLDQQLADVVAEAREAGATWTQIGDALGVSHQAAMKRFKRSA
ncbi:MAG: hypothetical protein GX555_11715 [Actinomycetales bacterium]|nr:hypothetical protein [Actinomycetales bacterium]